MFKTSIFTVVSSTVMLSGCHTLQTNPRVSQYESPVNQVMTEYSGILACLGEKIEAADVTPIEVYIRDIEDETVPTRFKERRLSKGAAWWFHTAIGKLETDKVTSITKRPPKKQRSKPDHIEISGAWTQDDSQIGVNSKNIGFDNLNGGILDRFGWFDRDEWSVIAGDFVSTIDGKVVHSSAIALTVKESGQDYNLRIEDGSRRFDFGFSSEANEGPQFAQRRIVEAATLVHISHTLQIDYGPCVVEPLGEPNGQPSVDIYMKLHSKVNLES